MSPNNTSLFIMLMRIGFLAITFAVLYLSGAVNVVVPSGLEANIPDSLLNKNYTERTEIFNLTSTVFVSVLITGILSSITTAMITRINPTFLDHKKPKKYSIFFTLLNTLVMLGLTFLFMLIVISSKDITFTSVNIYNLKIETFEGWNSIQNGLHFFMAATVFWVITFPERTKYYPKKFSEDNPITLIVVTSVLLFLGGNSAASFINYVAKEANYIDGQEEMFRVSKRGVTFKNSHYDDPFLAQSSYETKHLANFYTGKGIFPVMSFKYLGSEMITNPNESIKMMSTILLGYFDNMKAREDRFNQVLTEGNIYKEDALLMKAIKSEYDNAYSDENYKALEEFQKGNYSKGLDYLYQNKLSLDRYSNMFDSILRLIFKYRLAYIDDSRFTHEEDKEKINDMISEFRLQEDSFNLPPVKKTNEWFSVFQK